MANAYENAQRIVDGWTADIKAANSSATKPKIVEVHAMNRQRAEGHKLAALSINDLTEQLGCTDLLADPLFRKRCQDIGSLLNSISKNHGL